MTIGDLLKILRRRWIPAVITFVVIVAVSIAYLATTTRKYTATSQVFASYSSASSADNESSQLSQMSTASNYLSKQIDSYPSLVETDAVLQPVIDGLHLSMTTRQLAGEVSATNPTNTLMVNISVTDADPQLAAKIADATAQSLSDQVAQSTGGDKSPIALTVVQKASVPSKPSKPQSSKVLLAAIVLGLLAGCGMALLVEALDTKIHDSATVRQILGVSRIGKVPESDQLKQPQPIIVSDPASPIAEDFRRIRTNLSFLGVPSNEHKGKLIVFTSAIPSEGKTTVACNAAAALAESGASVMLIDADLRHPSVAKRFGMEGAAGLSHVLSGQAHVRDVVQRYWKKNFFVFPAGARPANSGMLLGSETMSKLIDQARDVYDYVLIDTAPLAVADDAIVFGRKAGGVVMVCARNKERRGDLEAAHEQLESAKVNPLGYIFTFVDAKSHGDSYGNYYYGYYYGYGEEKSDDKSSSAAHAA